MQSGICGGNVGGFGIEEWECEYSVDRRSGNSGVGMRVASQEW